MLTKKKPAPASQAPKQPEPDALAHHTATTLDARLRELRGILTRVTEETIRLEKARVQASELQDDRKYDTRRAGIALVAGGNDAANDALGLQDVHMKLALLRRLSRDLHAAIEVGEARVNVLHIKEQQERWTAAKPQYGERVRAVWKALIALDVAQAERDAFIRSLRVKPNVEAGPGWPMCGRLAHTESTVYRYGRTLVDIGALTEAQFQSDYRAAKAREA